MAIISRQTSLLAAENWKKLYQTFREADFSTYDFETLRKSMIDYLKLYYPEDFNDFTESSEFIALIDLIAFMGQSLAFRTDLNARENFLDTAERRDSVLKLARLISYNPKRAISASGFLKVDSISTSENVYDSNSLFAERWVNDDYSLNTKKIAEDIWFFQNKDKIVQKLVNDAVSKRITEYRKQTSNISVNNGNQANFNPSGEKSEIDRMADHFFSN
jgi:hypothetical protein